MRSYYALKSIVQLKKASLKGLDYKDFFQAGKSVQGIDEIEPAADVVARYAQAARAAGLLS